MHTRSNLIFLGGVHGVGKSTFAVELASALGGAAVSASQLIRDARQGQVNWTIEKHVTDIDRNQELLIAAVVERLRDGKLLVLDGHYVLKNAAGGIELLSINVFRALNPALFLVLIDRPESIAARRAGRDELVEDVAALEAMQVREKAHAHYLGEKLSIEVLEIAASARAVGLGRIRDVLGPGQRHN